MALLTPLALIGLIALPILVILHLRRPQRRILDVSSLLLWEGLSDETHQRTRRFRLRSWPLLLLQLLAVALLVGGLARPAAVSALATHRAATVYIVDDSVWMTAVDPAPSRLVMARTLIRDSIAHAVSGTRFTVVVASATPYILVSRANGAQAGRALASVPATEGAVDFASAFRLAAGVLTGYAGPSIHLVVVRAPENPIPAVSGLPTPIDMVVGHSTDDQGVTGLSVRCPLTARTACNAFATVRNEFTRAVRDVLLVRGDGDLLASQTLSLPPRSDTDLSFTVPRGQRIVQLQLQRPDILPADNSAWYVIESSPPVRVTLIGAPSRTARLQQALASLPGVTVSVGRPNQYRARIASASDLLVLDGWLPAGGLPPTPALLLIDPPALPGGRVGGAPPDATVSGEDTSSPLLAGVNLTSLDIPAGTAETVAPPGWAAPVVWTPAGPLVAAGINEGQAITVLSFDPAFSNLPQLTAYPLLLWNIVRWSTTWLPASVVPHERVVLAPPPSTTAVQVSAALTNRSLVSIPVSGVRPISFTPPSAGVYSVSERGASGVRTGLLAANPDASITAAPAPVHVLVVSPSSTSNGQVLSRELTSLWPWIGLLALLAIAAEWLYVLKRPV